MKKIEQHSKGHCATCICGRRAPVQGEGRGLGEVEKAPGSVDWSEHLEAYAVYAKLHGRSQSAERIAERGGFGYVEMTELLGWEPRTWRPR